MDTGLRHEWASWLSQYTWDYFITVTFREPLPRHRGASVLNSIVKSINRCGANPDLLFLGMEPHLSTFLHCHGLFKRRMDGYGLMPAKKIWWKLFQVYGYSKVEVIRSQEDASRYVTKYCVKALADYVLV